MGCGSKAKVPSVWGMDIFWNYTMNVREHQQQVINSLSLYCGGDDVSIFFLVSALTGKCLTLM